MLVLFNMLGCDFDFVFFIDGCVVYFCLDCVGGQGGDDLYWVRIGCDG